jgi:hypothetical protein
MFALIFRAGFTGPPASCGASAECRAVPVGQISRQRGLGFRSQMLPSTRAADLSRVRQHLAGDKTEFLAGIKLDTAEKIGLAS